VIKCRNKGCIFRKQKQEQERQQEQQDKPQFYSFRYIYTLHFRLYLHKTKDLLGPWFENVEEVILRNANIILNGYLIYCFVNKFDIIIFTDNDA